MPMFPKPANKGLMKLILEADKLDGCTFSEILSLLKSCRTTLSHLPFDDPALVHFVEDFGRLRGCAYAKAVLDGNPFDEILIVRPDDGQLAAVQELCRQFDFQCVSANCRSLYLSAYLAIDISKADDDLRQSFYSYIEPAILSSKFTVREAHFD